MPIVKRVIPDAQLLKTGQATQYSSELDDGYYEKGIAKHYTILTTGQHSGACVFVLDGKTENQSHECVRDLNTGLMWARYTSAESASVGAGADGKMAWTGTNDDIFQYAAAANVAELGGYSDWRIPNMVEAVSLMEVEAPDATPDSGAFPSWPVDKVWTSTTRSDDTTYAPRGGFDFGYLSLLAKTGVSFCALVRGGI